MASLPLDSRQARIARLLLERTEVASVQRLASDLHLTDRMVRYSLPSIEAYLGVRGLRLQKRRGAGVWVEGDASARHDVRAELDDASGPAVLDPFDRQSRVVLALLEAAPDPLRSESLEAILGVSRPTVRRDVRAAEVWLEQHRLHLRRLPGVGLAVRGSEVDVRAALLSLVLERVPTNALEAAFAGAANGHASGLSAYVDELDRATFR